MKYAWVGCALAALALVAGCARLPATGVTPLKVKTVAELRAKVLSQKPDVELFRPRGPFEVVTHTDREIRLSATERIDADLYLAAPAGKAPLVILLHGFDNSKEDHAYQAMHLATWGIHSIAVTLPNKGPWLENGRKLARLAELIRSQPGIIDKRVDGERIILAGHSFGGAAVAMALATGAPATGGILLDPAATGKGLPVYLRKVARPVMVIGADDRISPVRDRGWFYEHIRRNVAQVSIVDAHHEDAEFRLDPAPQDSESNATEELQITFVSALTAAAFSLGHAGSFDYAWASFRDGIVSGRFFDALKK
jgi:pimeloyl-ACP methyl ester carboxylesterase